MRVNLKTVDDLQGAAQIAIAMKRSNRPASRRTRSRVTAPESAPADSTPAAPAATPDALDAVAKAQEGLASAESFWKSAGRFCRLR